MVTDLLQRKLARIGIVRNLLFTKKPRQIEAKLLSKYASNGRTLDIGAKNKYNQKFFSNILTLNIEQSNGVDVIGSAEDMKEIFPDESFDTVLCLSVLEHVKDPREAVNEIRRVLKKGGLAIISAPFIMTLHDTPADYWRFTKYGLAELFKEFETVELNDNLDSLQTIGYMYHRLFLQTDTLYTRWLGIIFFLASKFHYLIHRIITGEYGYVNRSRLESAVAANCILGVFRRKNL